MSENKYSPFRNIGPQKPQEMLSVIEKRTEENRKMYEAMHFFTKDGDEFKIIDYMNWNNVIVEFVNSGYLKLTNMSNIKHGYVKDVFKINKYGGFVGSGQYSQHTDKYIYGVWFGILTRTSNHSSSCYENVYVCDEWKEFQKFAFWYHCYISGLNNNIGIKYHIDKDILQFGQKIKIYSPTTCCLIPFELNNAITSLQWSKTDNSLPIGVINHAPGKYSARCSYGSGKAGLHIGCFNNPQEAFFAYKTEKEKYIHTLADNFLSINAITREVRDAIYRIDIKPFGEFDKS